MKRKDFIGGKQAEADVFTVLNVDWQKSPVPVQYREFRSGGDVWSGVRVAPVQTVCRVLYWHCCCNPSLRLEPHQ